MAPKFSAPAKTSKPGAKAKTAAKATTKARSTRQKEPTLADLKHQVLALAQVSSTKELKTIQQASRTQHRARQRN